jgi:hypothetical protein
MKKQFYHGFYFSVAVTYNCVYIFIVPVFPSITLTIKTHPKQTSHQLRSPPSFPQKTPSIRTHSLGSFRPIDRFQKNCRCTARPRPSRCVKTCITIFMRLYTHTLCNFAKNLFLSRSIKTSFCAPHQVRTKVLQRCPPSHSIL